MEEILLETLPKKSYWLYQKLGKAFEIRWNLVTLLHQRLITCATSKSWGWRKSAKGWCSGHFSQSSMLFTRDSMARESWSSHVHENSCFSSWIMAAEVAQIKEVHWGLSCWQRCQKVCHFHTWGPSHICEEQEPAYKILGCPEGKSCICLLRWSQMLWTTCLEDVFSYWIWWWDRSGICKSWASSRNQG